MHTCHTYSVKRSYVNQKKPVRHKMAAKSLGTILKNIEKFDKPPIETSRLNPQSNIDKFSNGDSLKKKKGNVPSFAAATVSHTLRAGHTATKRMETDSNTPLLNYKRNISSTHDRLEHRKQVQNMYRSSASSNKSFDYAGEYKSPTGSFLHQGSSGLSDKNSYAKNSTVSTYDYNRNSSTQQISTRHGYMKNRAYYETISSISTNTAPEIFRKKQFLTESGEPILPALFSTKSSNQSNTLTLPAKVASVCSEQPQSAYSNFTDQSPIKPNHRNTDYFTNSTRDSLVASRNLSDYCAYAAASHHSETHLLKKSRMQINQKQRAQDAMNYMELESLQEYSPSYSKSRDCDNFSSLDVSTPAPRQNFNYYNSSPQRNIPSSEYSKENHFQDNYAQPNSLHSDYFLPTCSYSHSAQTLSKITSMSLRNGKNHLLLPDRSYNSNISRSRVHSPYMDYSNTPSEVHKTPSDITSFPMYRCDYNSQSYNNSHWINSDGISRCTSNYSTNSQKMVTRQRRKSILADAAISNYGAVDLNLIETSEMYNKDKFISQKRHAVSRCSMSSVSSSNSHWERVADEKLMDSFKRTVKKTRKAEKEENSVAWKFISIINQSTPKTERTKQLTILKNSIFASPSQNRSCTRIHTVSVSKDPDVVTRKAKVDSVPSKAVELPNKRISQKMLIKRHQLELTKRATTVEIRDKPKLITYRESLYDGLTLKLYKVPFLWKYQRYLYRYIKV